MLKNKLLVGIISLTVTMFHISAYANSITECKFSSDTEQMLVEGRLDKGLKNVLVNLYVYSLGDGSLKYADQAVTVDGGNYSFDIDVKNRFAGGGKFIIKTKAQIENDSQFVDKDGNKYKEFYLKSELQNIYEGIVADKTEPSLSQTIESKFDQLTFDDEQLKLALSKGYAQQVADIIKNDTQQLTLDNVKNALKKAALITNINNTSSDQIKTLIFDNDVLLGLSDNVIFKSLDVDNEKPQTLNTDWVNDFCARMSNFEIYVDSHSKFIELVEDMTVVSKAYYIKGKDGINNILNTYSNKFDFTVFNSVDNDKDEVLKSILVELENNRVKTISDIQAILNNKISTGIAKPDNSSNRGGGGGRGGMVIPVTKPTDTNPQNTNKVEQDIPHFNDIANYEWAEESIYNLAKRGVLSGYSEGVFAPMDNLTRAQLCKIICATFGMKTTYSKTKFTDVNTDSWYSGYISTLFEKGVINGVSENTFNPDANITRQDVCVIIHRILEKENLLVEVDLSTEFSDENSIDEYAKEAVKVLEGMGLISGHEGLFRPKDSINRAEIAVLIDNLYEYRNRDLIG